MNVYRDYLNDPGLVQMYDLKREYDVELPATSASTWFVSHAWGRPWMELVSIIWQHYQRQLGCVIAPGHWGGMKEARILPVFYWVDVWAVSQHFNGDFTKHPGQ